LYSGWKEWLVTVTDGKVTAIARVKGERKKDRMEIRKR
jgi:hypothetical protein